jgi:hypothetical protein
MIRAGIFFNLLGGIALWAGLGIMLPWWDWGEMSKKGGPSGSERGIPWDSSSNVFTTKPVYLSLQRGGLFSLKARGPSI